MLMTHSEMLGDGLVPARSLGDKLIPATLGHHGGPRATHFFNLLDSYLASTSPLDKAATETEIWKEFGSTCAPMILDMSGFSRVTRHLGILYYLGLVRRMQRVTFPLVQQYNGQVVKYEADNLFSTFPCVKAALDCAIAIQRECREVINQSKEVKQDLNKELHVSVGISFGSVLLLAGEDFYGDAVNVASKLGEDIAEKDEILISAEGLKQYQKEAPDAKLEYSTHEVEISHLMVQYYNIQWPK